MKFPYIHIENFMGIGNATVDLSDKGLVLIQGVNDDDSSADSNGAGKSTVPDALAWCITGRTRKGLSSDEVVNRTAGKNTHVTVHAFEDDGSYYVIERWRKQLNKGKRAGCSIEYHALDGTVTDKTGGTDKLTQVEIDKAIGCGEDVFMAAVYAAQEELPDLPSMTDTELKKLIEEASGITLLVKAYEIARLRLRDIERTHDSWRLDHVRLENDVTSIQTRIEDLKVRDASFEDRRKAELAGMNVDFTQATDRARRAKVRRDDVNVENVNNAIAALDAKIEAVHVEQETATELNVAWVEVNSKLATTQSIFDQMVQTARDHRADLDRIKERIGQPCTTCAKPYEAHDIAGATELLTEKLRLAVTSAQEKRLDVDALKIDETTARSALETFQAGRTDIRSTVEERRRLALLLVARQAAETEFDRDITEARRLNAAIDAKKIEVSPFAPLIEKADEELVDTLAAFRISEERGVGLERAIQVAKEVVKVYGPSGVRAHVLDAVTPYLNGQTSTYLGTMSDGNINAVWSTIQLNAKGDPTEKFAISVDKPGDAESFAGLSGGEKRKVRLACALALQDLVASRATKPIDLWIGDEIDDAMDDAGLERLMNVLETKARERGTVLVISHNSLRDWIRETAVVTRSGGYSTITGALDIVTPALAKVA